MKIILAIYLFFASPVACTKATGWTEDRQPRITWTDPGGKLCGAVWFVRGDGWYFSPRLGKLQIFPTQAAAVDYMEANYCSTLNKGTL